MKHTLFIILFSLFSGIAGAHPWEPAAFVIIDTDGGPDDMRAITLLLENPSVRVVGIIISGSSNQAEETYRKVRNLLKQLHHEGMLTGIAKESVARSLHAQSAVQVTKRIIKYLPEKITWVSLGKTCSGYRSLTAVPGYKDHLAKIIRVDNRDNREFISLLNVPEKEMTKVIDSLPEDPVFYREDIRPIVRETIRRYGSEEWYAGVLASEFHRHLGVFAIVGVKMGLRAREYFGAGPDEMTVVSHAGSKPPVSCMNDGLQASTGATLGHGLITVAKDPVASPAAEFTYLGNTIRIELTPETRQEIVKAVSHLKETWGLASDEYWDRLRELTIEKWSSLDRHHIFRITIPERQ